MIYATLSVHETLFHIASRVANLAWDIHGQIESVRQSLNVTPNAWELATLLLSMRLCTHCFSLELFRYIVWNSSIHSNMSALILIYKTILVEFMTGIDSAVWGTGFAHAHGEAARFEWEIFKRSMHFKTWYIRYKEIVHNLKLRCFSAS